MLDFKKLGDETIERAQFAARTDDDTRFLINDVRSHAYLTVGISGFADMVCRVRVRNTDDAVSVAAAIEDYRNGVDLSDDNTYSEESVTRLGIRTDIHEFTADGLTYKVVQKGSTKRQLLLATLHIFKVGKEGDPLILGRFEDVRQAKHVAHCMSMHLQG